MSSKKNENLDPQAVRKWITIIIAVLSAIAGAIGEAMAGVIWR